MQDIVLKEDIQKPIQTKLSLIRYNGYQEDFHMHFDQTRLNLHIFF